MSNIVKTTVPRNSTPTETTGARGSPAPPEPGNSERPFLQPHNFRAIRLAACSFGPPQKPKPDFSHRKKIRLRPEKTFYFDQRFYSKSIKIIAFGRRLRRSNLHTFRADMNIDLLTVLLILHRDFHPAFPGTQINHAFGRIHS